MQVKIARPNGQEFAGQVSASITNNGIYVEVFEWGLKCEFVGKYPQTQSPALSVSAYSLKKDTPIWKALGATPDIKRGVTVRLTNESGEAIMAAAESIRAEKKAEADTEKSRIEALPREYKLYDWFEWGDYTMKQHRAVWVHAVDGDKRHHIISYNLDETLNEEQKQDWKADFGGAMEQPEFVGQSSTDTRIVTEEVAKKWMAVWLENTNRAATEKLEKDRIRAEKEAKATEKSAADRADAEANELFIFQADVIYSSAGNKMLHSVGAIFGEKIEVYTTSYAAEMKREGITHTTTFEAKDELKSVGFGWDAENKRWKADFSKLLAERTIEILKKYDTKVWPGQLGMQRCLECGSYFTRSQCRAQEGDWNDSYCGC